MKLLKNIQFLNYNFLTVRSLLKYSAIFVFIWIVGCAYFMTSTTTTINQQKIYKTLQNVNQMSEILKIESNNKNFSKVSLEVILPDGLTDEAKNYIKELNITSPGENNKPVLFHRPVSEHIINKIEELYKKYGFNAFASSLVSLNRHLPDVRDEICKNRIYRTDKFSKVSIIIPFYNDEWSLLMRTVHSIIRNSPLHLIEEIILVDDYSTYDFLQDNLKNYTKSLPVTVKVIRTYKRLGIVSNRVFGARNAVAPVIIFADSHVEVVDGWLEPILDRFVDNMDLVVSPNITDINRFNLAVNFSSTAGMTMGMNWRMEFKWIPNRIFEGNKSIPIYDPKPTPIVIFAVLAIGRKFFEKIGYLDIDFDIWGGEDFELALRAWMCGGRVELVPCSLVAHMFREHKYKHRSKGKGGYRWNMNRIAEIWMGRYKRKYYRHVKPKRRRFGDIQERLKIKKDLKCKNFQWYLDNVFPALKNMD